MNEFIAYLLRFGHLNQHQIEFISSKIKEVKLSKNSYFIEAGKIPKQIGFIIEGIIRICYYNNKGEEVTKYFIDENHLIADYFHFIKKISSTEYGQAITDCKLIVITEKDWEDISSTIIGWDDIINKIVQNVLKQKLERRSILVDQDATTRYLSFLEKFPKVANRIPLSYLASYLGITQQSLSRIRNKITKIQVSF